jgi:hypothetical protein
MSRLVSGPSAPPVPIRARNKETEAQLGNARVALSASWKATLFLAGIIMAFFVFLLLLG